MKIRIEAPETVKVSVEMIDGELFVTVEDNKVSLAKKEAIQDHHLAKTFQQSVLVGPSKVHEPKKPKAKSAPLDPEIKAQALELIAAGHDRKAVARSFGIDARKLNGGRPPRKEEKSTLVHTEESEGFGSYV